MSDKVPNGFVRSDSDGNCIFHSISEEGICSRSSRIFRVESGWENLMMVDGSFRDDIIVFVYLHNGSDTPSCAYSENFMEPLGILSYSLYGVLIPIASLGSELEVLKLVEVAWMARVDEINYFSNLSMEIYTTGVSEGIIKKELK